MKTFWLGYKIRVTRRNLLPPSKKRFQEPFWILELIVPVPFFLEKVPGTFSSPFLVRRLQWPIALRQMNRKRTPRAHGARHGHLPVVGLGDVLDDGQAEAGAA